MTGQDSQTDEEDGPLEHWRQGDFALDVGGFLFAAPSDGDDRFDPEEIDEGIVGLVVVSQTCDIIRRSGGRHHVTVCPLVNRPDDEVEAIKKGYRPYFAELEHTDENVFADLRRVMSVSKDLLRSWDRSAGFSTVAKQTRFAAALERKFGQFAFPTEFDEATAKFRKRVWTRHDKHESEIGKIFRSLIQIRFRADPDWIAEYKKITVIAVLHDEDQREADRSKISKELEQSLGKVEWPCGYQWADPNFVLATPKDLRGDDFLSSQRADFDYLCV